ncbi:hypothetical protein PMAC_000591 [Pneumocystis sp. 'macacae']|nr:hypothetical protein PMAC_000591 [Pneumocystis sp. 'macacae']
MDASPPDEYYARPDAGDQRWAAYSRPPLGDAPKHGAFDHDTGGGFGLPPLSQAFSTYPQYPRLGYVEGGYGGQGRGYGGEMHGYFAVNRGGEELFPPGPPFMGHPPQTGPLGPALGSGAVPGAAPGPPAGYSGGLMNGQTPRVGAGFPAVGGVVGDAVGTQHLWPGYSVQGERGGGTPPSGGVSRGGPKGPGKMKQIYSFVPLPGAQTQKRPRRRYDEIERIYQCGWNGCEKAYGTLNHLNAHVFMQGHGEKRTPEGRARVGVRAGAEGSRVQGDQGAVAGEEEGGDQEEAGGGAAAAGGAEAAWSGGGGAADTWGRAAACGVHTHGAGAAECVSVWGGTAGAAWGAATPARIRGGGVPCIATSAFEPVYGAAAGVWGGQGVQGAWGGRGPGCGGGAGSGEGGMRASLGGRVRGGHVIIPVYMG